MLLLEKIYLMIMNTQYEEIIDPDEIVKQLKDSKFQESQDITKLSRFYAIFIASIQSGLSFLIEILPRTIVYLILANINKSDLIASIGLGNILIKSISQGIQIEISIGLETLVAQAFGAQEFELCGHLFYRALFLSTFIMIPTIFLHYYSIIFYQMIVKDVEIIENAWIYTKYMLFAIWLNSLYIQTKVFLNGQNIYNYQLYSQCASSLINVFFQYLFIVNLNYDILGVVYAQTISEFCGIGILIYFIIKTECSKITLVYFKIKETILKCFSFFIAAFPIGSIVWIEMLCFQTYTIQAGYLSTAQFTSFIILFTLGLIAYSFSLGIEIAVVTFVGNEMGRKNVNQAKNLSFACFIIFFLFLLGLIMIILLFRKQLSSMITDESEIQFYIEITLPYFCVMILFDGLQTVLSGLVRAIGKAKYAFLYFILCYIFVGNFVIYYLVNWKQFDVRRVWIGISLGSFVYCVIQIINITWNDWRDLLENIHLQINDLKK
ncbi:hypothetical protein pb186bvf_014472 [Paramecium bursaria]